jgi:serine/threonine protein kinase
MFTSIRPEGYQDISVFSYSPNASIVVLSATDINSAKVLLKSALIDLNQDSSPLFNEFSNIQAVIQFHEKNRFTRPVSRRRSSSVNDAVRNLGNISEDAAKSYKGPASWSNLDTIIAPLSIDRSTGRNVYVYRDYGSTSLSEYILQLPDNKLSIESAIRIGFSISQALDLVHQAGFICQNICSKNVNIWWDDNVLHSQLASFEMASGVQQVATVYAIENNNLGYISPEQTGKVEREVDHRTDLYSLGILLWEILVGRLPFRDKGSKQVIYAHMARVPENPKNLNKLVPDVLSKIIMKLLRKDPVDRYQSASALTYDLSLCLDAIIKFRSKNEVPSELELSHEELALVFGKLSYELGSKDFYSTLQYTKRLYGKDYELDTLRNIYHETALGNLVGMVVMLKGTAYSGRKELLKTAAKHALAYGMITGS